MNLASKQQDETKNGKRSPSQYGRKTLAAVAAHGILGDGSDSELPKGDGGGGCDIKGIHAV